MIAQDEEQFGSTKKPNANAVNDYIANMLPPDLQQKYRDKRMQAMKQQEKAYQSPDEVEALKESSANRSLFGDLQKAANMFGTDPLSGKASGGMDISASMDERNKIDQNAFNAKSKLFEQAQKDEQAATQGLMETAKLPLEIEQQQNQLVKQRQDIAYNEQANPLDLEGKRVGLDEKKFGLEQNKQIAPLNLQAKQQELASGKLDFSNKQALQDPNSVETKALSLAVESQVDQDANALEVSGNTAGATKLRQNWQALKKQNPSATQISLFAKSTGIESGKLLTKVQGKGLSEKDLFEMENKIRDEHSKDPVTKNTAQIRQAYSQMSNYAANPSPANDIALVYAFMKAQDPGSTVREGEFATAQNSGGISAGLVARYNALIGGGRLADSQRNDLLKAAKSAYDQQTKLQTQVDDKYTKLSVNYGLDPKRTVSAFEAAPEGTTTTPAAPAEEIRMYKGVPMRKVPGGWESVE